MAQTFCLTLCLCPNQPDPTPPFWANNVLRQKLRDSVWSPMDPDGTGQIVYPVGSGSKHPQVYDYDLFLKAFLTWDFHDQESRIGKPYLYALFLRIFQGIYNEILVEKFGDCIRNIACQMLKDTVPNGDVELLRKKMRSTKANGPDGRKFYAVPYCTLRRPSSFHEPNVQALCLRLGLTEADWQDRLCGWTDEWLQENPCVDPEVLKCKLQTKDPDGAVTTWMGPQGRPKRPRKSLLEPIGFADSTGVTPPALLQPGPVGMPTPTPLHRTHPVGWHPTELISPHLAAQSDLTNVGAGFTLYESHIMQTLPNIRGGRGFPRQTKRLCPPGPVQFLRVVPSASHNHTGVRVFVPGDQAMYTLETTPTQAGSGSTVVQIGLRWPEPQQPEGDVGEFMAISGPHPNIVKWLITVSFPVTADGCSRYNEDLSVIDPRAMIIPNAPLPKRALSSWAVFEWRRPTPSQQAKQRQAAVDSVGPLDGVDLGMGGMRDGPDDGGDGGD